MMDIQIQAGIKNNKTTTIMIRCVLFQLYDSVFHHFDAPDSDIDSIFRQMS